jgi:cobalamin biosynthesis Co2+ chelatase CbiK
MPTKKKLLPSATLTTSDSDAEKDYEAFVQGLEVVGIGMTSCACAIDRGAYFKIKERVQAFSHDYELVKVGENFLDAAGHYTVTVAGSKDAPPAIRVQCSFLTHIHGNKPVLREHAERFANSELKLILVPYARQLVSSMTSQMSISPVIIPLTKRVNSERTTRKRLPK